jgi:hypothetical protein
MIIAAALVATLLFVAMAGFQAALAAGAPLGAHVLGGRNPGMLPGRLRVASAIAAIMLLGFAVVVLARAGAIETPSGLDGAIRLGCWIVAGFLVLNTLGNVTSKSPIERRLFAGMTALLAVLAGAIALTG